jgi:uncharacterized protein (TIGR02145 family)
LGSLKISLIKNPGKMKNILFLIAAILFNLASLAQEDAGIAYQTIIRDAEGNILANTEINIQMTIYAGAPDGAIAYQETHDATSNTFGLVNLVVGNGTVQIGNFESIHWGKAIHYLETAVDFVGTLNFMVLGTSQFLNVPYARYADVAGSISTMTTQERNAIENPQQGMRIFNLTTNCINYFNGSNWYETCGNPLLNTPPNEPYNPIPGDGTFDNPTTNTLSWECSDPENDPLFFDVYFGMEYPPPLVVENFIDFFYELPELEPANLYYWKIVARDIESNITEGPTWEFETWLCSTTWIYAGPDDFFCENNSYYLQYVEGEGFCSISWNTSGDGTFDAPYYVYPTYTPGPEDIANGFVYLTIDVTECPNCPPEVANDEIYLEIQALPAVDAGPDQLEVSGNTTTLDGNVPPTSYAGFWTIQSGDGGNVAEPSNPNSTFSGIIGNTYLLRWEISNTICSNFDEVEISFIDNWLCGQDFNDARDGNLYGTMLLNDQCWMTENLNAGGYIDGSEDMTDNQQIEKYCYGDDPANCEAYGALYTWDEAMQYTNIENTNGVCPPGWHLPSKADWDSFADWVSSQPEYQCGGNTDYIGKAVASSNGWNTSTGACAVGNNQLSNNASGFAIVPGGHFSNGSCFQLGNYGNIWTSTEDGAEDAWVRYLHYGGKDLKSTSRDKNRGYNLRCVHD